MQALPLTSPSGISIVPATVEHAPAFAAFAQENIEHLRVQLPGVARLSCVDAATEHFRSTAQHAARTEIFEWLLFVEGELCGSVRLKHIDMGDRKAEIGYLIGQGFTGKGIASSAVSTVLAFAFGELNLNRIELQCAAGNEPSKRVANRLGFVHEGVLRQDHYLNGSFVDIHVYGLLAREFVSST